VSRAQCEEQAAETLLNAAPMLANQPQALQLRNLQTLTETAGEKNSTIVFPMPIDLVNKLFSEDKPNR